MRRRKQLDDAAQLPSFLSDEKAERHVDVLPVRTAGRVFNIAFLRLDDEASNSGGG